MSETKAMSRMEALREMLFMRRFEERCVPLYQQERIRGFLHLYVGQEAVAVGVGSLLTPEDSIVGTYREHIHALAKGVPPEAVMAEMFGRTNGCSGGRGGSMHLFSREHRFFGGNAIVGGGLPLAVGLGLADLHFGGSSVCACFFGEGAIAEGAFHESMNLAALWKTPVLFACENNLYAMGTALVRSEASTDLALRAGAYGMPAWSVDGMDIEAVIETTRHALAHIRAGQGPVFIEYRTYRFRPHSMYDPELYRSKEEIEQWRARDPLTVLGDRLRAVGELDDEIWAAMEAEVDAEIEDAVGRASDGGLEPVESLARHVLAESDDD
jgi:pyruvate dehydrogenase E1 component alpha subunit